MTGLLIYAMAVVGFAYIVGHSRMSLPIREYLSPTPDKAPPLGGFGPWLVDLVECPACLSTHVGLWCGFFGWPVQVGSGSAVGDAIVLAFASSGIGFIAGKLTKLI